MTQGMHLYMRQEKFTRVLDRLYRGCLGRKPLWCLDFVRHHGGDNDLPASDGLPALHGAIGGAMEGNPLANPNLCKVFRNSLCTSSGQRFQHPGTLQLTLLGESTDIDESATGLCSSGHLLQCLLHRVRDGGFAAGEEEVALDLGTLNASLVADSCPFEGISFSDVDTSGPTSGDTDLVGELHGHQHLGTCVRNGDRSGGVGGINNNLDAC